MELRKIFSVPEHLEVITSLIIGYPKYRYSRDIKRNPDEVRWLWPEGARDFFIK